MTAEDITPPAPSQTTTAPTLPPHAGLWFSAAFGLLLLLAVFFWLKIPHDNQLMAVPGVLLLVASTVPILYWQTVSSRRAAQAIATTSSCIIWIVGILLALNIKPTSVWVFVGDAMMLLGFFPLLYLWRYSWPWIVFGVINGGIGILLQVIVFIPDGFFPASLLPPKHHLMTYHPPMAWWLVGLFATGFGVGRLSKNLSEMLAKRG